MAVLSLPKNDSRKEKRGKKKERKKNQNKLRIPDFKDMWASLGSLLE